MELYRKYFDAALLERLTNSEPNWGVNVLTVGHYIHKPYTAYPDPEHPKSHYFNWENGRRLNEFQIVYIANGKGVFEWEGHEAQIVEKGTLFLLYPNVWHRYKPLNETGWEEFWVGYNGHYAEYLMKQDCFKPDQPILSIGFNAEFLVVFMRLIETINHQGVAFTQISSCLVIQLLGLVYASALITEKNDTRQEVIIRTIRYKIHQCWEQEIDIEKLAHDHNLSYVWFRKTFKEIIGVAPRQYHLNIKAEKASHLLRETSLPVAEIAVKIGFESEFYFSRFFKNRVGCTPSQFRNKNT
jgi:AraC-like DNA-binding protein